MSLRHIVDGIIAGCPRLTELWVTVCDVITPVSVFRTRTSCHGPVKRHWGVSLVEYLDRGYTDAVLCISVIVLTVVILNQDGLTCIIHLTKIGCNLQRFRISRAYGWILQLFLYKTMCSVNDSSNMLYFWFVRYSVLCKLHITVSQVASTSRQLSLT